ncbi:hypothetical protein GJR88_04047 [Dietzia sp. DQ12-45-1b]|nr:hypothetical protein GJR88_04047 [Dietzia sp. DQ12-45-1b]
MSLSSSRGVSFIGGSSRARSVGAPGRVDHANTTVCRPCNTAAEGRSHPCLRAPERP